MRDTIQELIAALSHLSKPYTFNDLISTFTIYNHLFDDNCPPPDDLSQIWHSLRNIRTQLSDWKQLETEQQLMKTLEEQIIQYNAELKTLDDNIQKTKDTLKIQRLEFKKPYETLFNAYKDYLRKKEPLIAINVPTSFQQQQSCIQIYLEYLKAEQITLARQSAQLKLAEYLLERNKLIEKLKNVNVIISVHSSDSVTIFDKLSKANIEFLALQENLELAQQKLSASITEDDIKKKIHTIETNQTEIKAQQMSIAASMEETALDNAVKQKLTDAYLKASDKLKFIETQNVDVSWSNSTLNIVSWYKWGTSNTYHADLHCKQTQSHYLNLLHKHETLTIDSASLLHELEKTTQLTKLTPALVVPQSEIIRLHDETLTFLHQLPANYCPKKVDSICLLTQVNAGLEFISDKLEEFFEALKILPFVQKLDSEILALRTTNLFIEEAPDLIPTQDILNKLRAEESPREKRLQELDIAITECNTCIVLMQRIVVSQNLLIKFNQQKHHIELDLDIKKREPKIDCRPHESKKAQIQNCVALQILELDKEISIDTSTNVATPVAPIKTTEESEKFKKIIQYQDNLNLLNRSISNHTIPKQFQNWYQQLFIALQTNVKDEISYNQASHLLQDIGFEFQNHYQDKNYAVLSHYQNLCQTPTISWKTLADFKPSFSISQEKLERVQNKQLQTRLAALYQQYKHLAPTHPVEAALLYQAVHHLHRYCLLAEQHPKHPELKTIGFNLCDPRYEVLHKHRGFYKLTERLAELYISLLSFIQNGHTKNYRQLYFFKPTKTASLLENATTALNRYVAAAG